MSNKDNVPKLIEISNNYHTLPPSPYKNVKSSKTSSLVILIIIFIVFLFIGISALFDINKKNKSIQEIKKKLENYRKNHCIFRHKNY